MPMSCDVVTVANVSFIPYVGRICSKSWWVTLATVDGGADVPGRRTFCASSSACCRSNASRMSFERRSCIIFERQYRMSVARFW